MSFYLSLLGLGISPPAREYYFYILDIDLHSEGSTRALFAIANLEGEWYLDLLFFHITRGN